MIVLDDALGLGTAVPVRGASPRGRLTAVRCSVTDGTRRTTPGDTARVVVEASGVRRMAVRLLPERDASALESRVAAGPDGVRLTALRVDPDGAGSAACAAAVDDRLSPARRVARVARFVDGWRTIPDRGAALAGPEPEGRDVIAAPVAACPRVRGCRTTAVEREDLPRCVGCAVAAERDGDEAEGRVLPPGERDGCAVLADDRVAGAGGRADGVDRGAGAAARGDAARDGACA